MDDLFMLGAPWAKGPSETGYEAAAAVAEDAARLRPLALRRIAAAGASGLTAEELASVMAVPRETIQPRTSELRVLGKIADSGQRRLNRSGKRAIVWTLPEYAQPKQVRA